MNAPSPRREPTPAHGAAQGLRMCGRHGEHASWSPTPGGTSAAGPQSPCVAALQRIARRYLGQLESARARVPVCSTLGPVQGAALWAGLRRTIRPSTGANPAEIEASLWSRECHGRDRVDKALRDRTRAWTARADRARRKIIWRFTTAKARRVFRYKKQRSTMSRSTLVPRPNRGDPSTCHGSAVVI